MDRSEGKGEGKGVKMRYRDIELFFKGKRSLVHGVFGLIRGDFKTF